MFWAISQCSSLIIILCVLSELLSYCSAIHSHHHDSNQKQRKSHSPNILVIVFGQLRGGPMAWESMLHYLVHFYAADLAIIGPLTDVGTTEELELQQNAKYVWQVEDMDDWGVFFDNIDKNTGSSWRGLCQLKSNFLGFAENCQGNGGSAGVLLAYRHIVKLKIQQLRLHDIYDFFVFLRADYLWLCSPLPVFALNHDTIYIPKGEGWGGYTDRYSVVPSKLALEYFNITTNIIVEWRELLNYCLNVRSDNCTNRNIESTLHHYLTSMNLPVETFPHTAFTVRRKNLDTTSWAGGYEVPGITDKYGLLVKYTDEMWDAIRWCFAENKDHAFRVVDARSEKYLLH